jgi:nitrate reductase gamma subunit
MGSLALFIFYGSILFFLICSMLRVKRFAAAPVHLHWELYTGSSVYELRDWWTKTPDTFWVKLAGVTLDVLFLRDFYRRNRRFWYALYCFHVGLYLLILWHLWLFTRAFVMSGETASAFGWIGGTFSTALAFGGGAGILFKRLTDEELNIYYPRVHYLKWIFILLTLLGGFWAVTFHFHSSMPELLRYVREQVTFQDWGHKLHPALAPALHVLFAAAWLIYLPFGHVFQLFFRYYHHLRWDDLPNKRGSDIERRVKELLDRPVGWSATHIQPGKQWKEVASETPPTPGAGTK